MVIIVQFCWIADKVKYSLWGWLQKKGVGVCESLKENVGHGKETTVWSSLIYLKEYERRTIDLLHFQMIL